MMPDTTRRGASATDEQQRAWGRILRAGVRGTLPDGGVELTPGAEEARACLVRANLRLVGSIVDDLANLSGDIADDDDGKQEGLLVMVKRAHKWDPDHPSRVTFANYVAQSMKRKMIQRFRLDNNTLSITRTVIDGSADTEEAQRDAEWALASKTVGFDAPAIEGMDDGATIGERLGEDPTAWLDGLIDAQLAAARGVPHIACPPAQFMPSEAQTIAAQLVEVKHARKPKDLTPWLNSRLRPVREAALRRLAELSPQAPAPAGSIVAAEPPLRARMRRAQQSQDPRQLDLFPTTP